MLAALEAVSAGRRGPGMPGSAESFPGEYPSPAAGFATVSRWMSRRAAPRWRSFLEDAAGEDDRYAGASDDELAGVICAWDRVEANASAGKHAAVAELIRRRAAPGCALAGPAQMPEGWDEFTRRELGAVLGVSAGDAEEILGLAHTLEVHLPGTKAAFRAGIVNREKAAIIAWATALLDPAEARAAEALVLDRAGSLTPAQLRAAIRRAVMDVNPDKARQRREHMARRTRVERWAEDSGNAGLAGPGTAPRRGAGRRPAGHRVGQGTAQGRAWRAAWTQLRARAYLDILLGIDSRPLGSGPDGTLGQPVGQRRTGPAERDGPDGPGSHEPRPRRRPGRWPG